MTAAASAPLCAMLVGPIVAGCATTIGGAGASSLEGTPETLAGFSGSALVDVSLVEMKPNVASGVQSRVLGHLKDRTTPGDWRLQGVIGLAHMPRQHECFLGYEAFVAAGLARYTHGARSAFGSALGLEAGAPLRLSQWEPPWRADDLVGLQYYLVPSVGVNALGLEQLELTLGVSARMTFWSGITP